MKRNPLDIEVLNRSEYCLYSLLENKLRVITQNQVKLAQALEELLASKPYPGKYFE